MYLTRASQGYTADETPRALKIAGERHALFGIAEAARRNIPGEWLKRTAVVRPIHGTADSAACVLASSASGSSRKPAAARSFVAWANFDT